MAGTETNPLHHTKNMRHRFGELIQHLREDIGKMDEPKAKAMFETTAEVLEGLVKTFEDYERKNERIWRS